MIKLIAINVGLYAFCIAAVAIAVAAFLEFKDIPHQPGEPFPANISFQLFAMFYFGPFGFVVLHFAKLPLDLAQYLWRSAQ